MSRRSNRPRCFFLMYRSSSASTATQIERVCYRNNSHERVGLWSITFGSNGKPSLINIDKSGANTAGIKQYNRDENKRAKIRQCKYLSNNVEQMMRHSDHRFIKRIVRRMLGLQACGFIGFS